MTVWDKTKWTSHTRYWLAMTHLCSFYDWFISSVLGYRHWRLFPSIDVLAAQSGSRTLSSIFHGTTNFHRVWCSHVSSWRGRSCEICHCRLGWCRGNPDFLWVYRFALWCLRWCDCRNQQSRWSRVLRSWQWRICWFRHQLSSDSLGRWPWEGYLVPKSRNTHCWHAFLPSLHQPSTTFEEKQMSKGSLIPVQEQDLLVGEVVNQFIHILIIYY